MSDLTDEHGVPVTDDRVAILIENHRALLKYLQRRIGSVDAAEDILQDAFARSLDRLDAIPHEAVVPWFYRVLRNALIDRARRRGTANRALAAFAKEVEAAESLPDELKGEICACVGRLARTLKPEYADALRAVDLDGMSIKAFAENNGLTPANAGVRVFRARQALRRRVAESCGTCAEHGCLDCSCGKHGH